MWCGVAHFESSDSEHRVDEGKHRARGHNRDDAGNDGGSRRGADRLSARSTVDAPQTARESNQHAEN